MNYLDIEITQTIAAILRLRFALARIAVARAVIETQIAIRKARSAT